MVCHQYFQSPRDFEKRGIAASQLSFGIPARQTGASKSLGKKISSAGPIYASRDIFDLHWVVVNKH